MKRTKDEKKSARNMKKRAILAIVALLLLLAMFIYMTVAWYTKNTAVAPTEFHAARWDFTANYQVDDFFVNVYEYEAVDGRNIAAPGTAGTIDLLLSALDSDVDVKYMVQIDKSTMSSAFQDRIYFYYLNSSGNKQEFIFGEDALEGVIKAKSSAIVTLYWEWVYDYADYLAHGGEPIPSGSIGSSGIGSSGIGSSGTAELQSPEDIFDAFDNLVGADPEYYSRFMTATVYISGEQLRPDPTAMDRYPDPIIPVTTGEEQNTPADPGDTKPDYIDLSTVPGEVIEIAKNYVGSDRNKPELEFYYRMLEWLFVDGHAGFAAEYAYQAPDRTPYENNAVLMSPEAGIPQNAFGDRLMAELLTSPAFAADAAANFSSPFVGVYGEDGNEYPIADGVRVILQIYEHPLS